jgi:hypothetical protein
MTDNVSDVFNKLGITILNFVSQIIIDQIINHLHKYDKNLSESNIIQIVSAENLKYLLVDVTINKNVLHNSLQTLTFAANHN